MSMPVLPVLSVLASFLLFLSSSASGEAPANLQWDDVLYMGALHVNGSVAAVSFNDVDHLLYRDGDSNFLMHLTSADGHQWSKGQVPIGQVANAPGVAVSVDGKRLHIFYVESDSHRVRHVYQDVNGEYVRPPEDDLQIRVGDAPSAAIGDDSSICVVGTATEGWSLVFSKRNDSSSGYHTVSSGWTGFTQSAPPSVVWWRNAFHAFYLDARGDEIVHIQSSDCISWQKAEEYDIGFRSFTGPAAFVLPATASHDAELRILFRNESRTVVQCASFDGINFEAAMDPITYMTLAGPPSAAWSPMQHGLFAGGDVYQSGSGQIYTGIRYARSKRVATPSDVA